MRTPMHQRYGHARPSESAVQDLDDRLNTGWDMIDAEPDPRRRRRLEDHWLQLLREYETACDAAAMDYAPMPLEVA